MIKKIGGLLTVLFLVLAACGPNQNYEVPLDPGYIVKVDPGNISFQIVDAEGRVLAPPHLESGVTLNDQPVIKTSLIQEGLDGKTYSVVTKNGLEAAVSFHSLDHTLKVEVTPKTERVTSIGLQLGGMPVAHGLGDAGAYDKAFNLVKNDRTYSIVNNGGSNRWVSTFAIFPHNNVAGVFFDKGKREVTLNRQEYVMKIAAEGKATFYYFFGEPKQLYASYKKTREALGYFAAKPKSRLFELGWESWDALGWNTNQYTVKDFLRKFHKNGFPIRWAVTGSGFWETGGTTTSFGRWGDKFPDTDGFREWLNSTDIKWMIGLRTNFIPEGGPYLPVTDKRDKNLKVSSFSGNNLSEEGKSNEFFLKDGAGSLVRKTSSIFPLVPSYLLDGERIGAAQWYSNQYDQWKVDGIKEDTMMDLDSLTNIYNKPILAIADKGGHVMARNGEFVATGTLLRINDTGVREIERRIPNNYLQYAASGFPNVYSDVAGIHNMHNLEEIDKNIRHTWLLSSTAGMAVGAFPDGWPEEKLRAFRKALNFHERIVPYMYSAAIEGYETGYPYTLTPMTIAYPKDQQLVYFGGYQWMIGRSLLAAPLLQDTGRGERDIYLPEGSWIDYESGEHFTGPKLLENYPLKLDQVPCFVGGQGIIVERLSKKKFARIYPLADETTFQYYGLDSKLYATITIDNPDWGDFVIKDLTTDKIIPTVKNRFAFEFKLSKGHRYLIR